MPDELLILVHDPGGHLDLHLFLVLHEVVQEVVARVVGPEVVHVAGPEDDVVDRKDVAWYPGSNLGLWRPLFDGRVDT